MEETNKETSVVADYYSGYQELELQAAETHVKKARNALLLVGGLSLILNLVVLGTMDSLSGWPLAIAIGITLAFVGLALLTAKQPFTAIILGLVIYIGLWIVDIVVTGPEQLLKGLLMKGIVIYFLIMGLKHAREAERLRKEIRAK
jgi:hypothetical protein